jgi:serine/threonine protein kinase/Tol biopolymer transport system component
MGEVYRARDSRLGRDVAVKVLPAEVSRDPTFKQRFEREARTISQLQHPSICTLHDVGSADGVDYLVMEYLEGETLADRLDRGALPIDDVIRVGCAIAEAVHAAHRRGVVHRDLKPGNVMLTPAGTKVLDFGLAKAFGLGKVAVGELGVDTHLPTAAQPPTIEGTIVGTPQYMAPEQLEGKNADARTDVWALGCILYEIATGQRPFSGTSHASLFGSILKDLPEPLSRKQPLAPARLDWIVARCLEKDPERRWQSARDVSIELEALGGEGTATAESLPVGAAASERRRFAAWVASIAAAVALTWLTADLLDRRSASPEVVPFLNSELQIRQLTARPSNDTVHTAALSPDGEQLAFATQQGLFLQIVETGEERLLPLPEELQVLEVDWLGATNLLFSASTGDAIGLYKTSIFGGTSRKLTDGAWRAAVTADGERIAYLQGVPSRTVTVSGPDGENPRRALDMGERGSVWEIAWSPDGRWLLAGTWGGALDFELQAIELDSGARKTVLTDFRFFQHWRGFLPFFWTAGDRLVIGRTESAPNALAGNLWQTAIDRSTATVQGDLMRLTQLTGMNPKDLSATANGRRLAFLCERSQSDVMVAKLEDGGRRLKELQRVTADERDDRPLAWARDSRTLFFQSARTGSWSVFAAALEGGNARFLAEKGDAVNHATDVSPDGRFVLFWRASELVRVPAAGGPTQVILTGGVWPGISCAASGDPCLIGERSLEDATYAFWRFDPEAGRGEEALRIDDHPPFSNWDLSPDGSRVVVGNNDDRLRVFDLATGGETVLTHPGLSYGEFPAWSSDGNGVFVDGGYATRGRLRKGLLYLSLADGEAHVLRDVWDEWDTYALPSPDGKRLAFAANTYDANAWLIEDF